MQLVVQLAVWLTPTMRFTRRRTVAIAVVLLAVSRCGAAHGAAHGSATRNDRGLIGGRTIGGLGMGSRVPAIVCMVHGSRLREDYVSSRLRAVPASQTTPYVPAST